MTHVHPLSRGSIVRLTVAIAYVDLSDGVMLQHITSTSINDHPHIDPNFFDSEWDKWILAKASAYGRKLFQTDALQEIVVREEYPGCECQRFLTMYGILTLLLTASYQTDADWIKV